MSEKMEFRAHDIVLEYIQRHLDKSDDVPNIEIYTVWKCKILQNWKFLISSSLLDGMYYELTFNGDKNEWYLDAYKKFENQVIREDTVNAPQTKRYDYSKSVMENIKCGNGITREIPQNEKEQPIKIGDEVYVHGYIDEIRQDIVIIRNNGGYFGTFSSEVVDQEPCEDLISRQAAIDAFDGVKVDEKTEYDIGYNDGIDLAVSKLSVLPSAQPERKTDGDTISRQAAIDALYDKGLSMTAWGELLAMKWSDIQTCIELLPSADRPTGHWIEHDDERVLCECSECHEKYLLYEEHVLGRNFCPNCGCAMKGSEEE